jgi:integrase
LPFAALTDLVTLFNERRAATTKLEQAAGKIIARVFHRNGRPIRDLRKAWATACNSAGVPGRLFHDLRRCASRNLRRAGVSESVAMKVTGHLTPSIFKRYDIVDETDIGDALGSSRARFRAQLAKNLLFVGLEKPRKWVVRKAVIIISANPSASSAPP